MINSLDEAIKHAEKMAEKKEIESNNWTYGASQINDDESRRKQYLKHAEMWHDCANEYRQLAEWLRELQAYREAEKEIEQELVNWNDIDNGKCRGLFLATSIIQHYKNEEVNANDSN